MSGTLWHEDTAGHRAMTPAGWVQLLSAGTGVEHVERSADERPVRFVQAWLVPDDVGPPRYARHDPATGPARPLRRAGVALHVVPLPAGTSSTVPAAPLLHVSVLRGRTTVEGAGELGDGDELRGRSTAVRVTAVSDAELLVWALT